MAIITSTIMKVITKFLFTIRSIPIKLSGIIILASPGWAMRPSRSSGVMPLGCWDIDSKSLSLG